MEHYSTIPNITSRFADPRVDFAFKRAFGTERYKDATINLLNSIIPDHDIKDVTFLNTEIIGDTSDSRKSYIDVLCEDNDGTKFIVEMQKAKQSNFRQRAVFYASKVISMLPPQGNSWDYGMPPSYVIAFLDFPMAEMLNKSERQDLGKDDYILHYVCRETESGGKMPGSTEYIFLGLQDFNKKEEDLTTYPEKWLYLLKHTTLLDSIPDGYQSDRTFTTYFEACERAGYSKEEEQRYITDMMNDWDIANAKREACEEARAEGRAKGLAEGEAKSQREIAKKMLSDGMGIDVISKYTSLSEEEIKSLQSE